ncbi:hypothetical protein [Brevibacillus laterosporus]|uniref:Uncharacterized protein n=1 Tax=Brevibacillus laterosporus TaxID=1465 RepID=A0AAP3DJ83_BRELA|nr:hypothetical protein [Brevibacillus laterosporus]MCR8980930.1 hypothetical protein [Brevibacillus laterosporus]MCZ0808085.1 hypothetical protein [Brevibacillus laterosporus]MCZ0826277.1 hypothetical protein [Brevibacillus laterosporus]MCZ0850160.1 hypothetical protein [Brevibacillus laterosporus]
MSKEIVTNELIGGTFDRMVSYKTNGTLEIEEVSECNAKTGWTPKQTVTLRNWEEIVKLRDFLNGLVPVNATINEEDKRHANIA